MYSPYFELATYAQGAQSTVSTSTIKLFAVLEIYVKRVAVSSNQVKKFYLCKFY